MSKRILLSIGFLGVAWLIPAQAQELQQLTFAIGGGISAPLNPTSRYVGVSGNFVTGVGVNINKNNSIEKYPFTFDSSLMSINNSFEWVE